MYLCYCMYQYSIAFNCWVVFHSMKYRSVCLCIHPLKDFWIDSGFWPLWRVSINIYRQTCVNICLYICLDKYPRFFQKKEVGFLGHMVSIYWIIQETDKLFSTVSLLFYYFYTILLQHCTRDPVALHYHWHFLIWSIHKYIYVYLMLVILIAVVSYSGLICISVMANDVEHLVICLFTILISSWAKCLYMFSCHFFIELFASYTTGFECSLYTLYTSSALQIPFYPVWLFFHSLTVIHREKVFNFFCHAILHLVFFLKLLIPCLHFF